MHGKTSPIVAMGSAAILSSKPEQSKRHETDLN